MSDEDFNAPVVITQNNTQLADLVENIKAEHEAAARGAQTWLRHAMNAGDHLCRLKLKVGHGNWLPYVVEHCDMSVSTARIYMRAARNRERIESSNQQRAVDMTLNDVIKLLKGPPDKVIEAVEANGDPALVDLLDEGKIKPSDAMLVANLTKKQQQKALVDSHHGVQQKAKEIRERAKTERARAESDDQNTEASASLTLAEDSDVFMERHRGRQIESVADNGALHRLVTWGAGLLREWEHRDESDDDESEKRRAKKPSAADRLYERLTTGPRFDGSWTLADLATPGNSTNGIGQQMQNLVADGRVEKLDEKAGKALLYRRTSWQPSSEPQASPAPSNGTNDDDRLTEPDLDASKVHLKMEYRNPNTGTKVWTAEDLVGSLGTLEEMHRHLRILCRFDWAEEVEGGYSALPRPEPQKATVVPENEPVAAPAPRGRRCTGARKWGRTCPVKLNW